MQGVSIAVVKCGDGFAVGGGEDGGAVFAGNVWEVLGECWLWRLLVLSAAWGSGIRSYDCSRYWVCEACHAEKFTM